MSPHKRFKLSKLNQFVKMKISFAHLQNQDQYTDHLIPVDFAAQVLESLINKGLSGYELVEKFKEVTLSTGWTVFRANNER